LRPYRIQLHEALMSIGCGLTEDGAKGMAARQSGSWPRDQIRQKLHREEVGDNAD
jgi:hypothetical protein